MVFQFFDLATQGRLANETAFGSLAKMAGFSNGNQVFEVA
jgi:hypothetical protein